MDSANLDAVIASFQIVGVVLLAREVWIGHQLEQLGQGMAFASRMLQHYAARDYTGLMILSRLDQGDTVDQARTWASLGEDALRKGAEDMIAALAPSWQASIRRWNEQTVPAAASRRRAFLVLGSTLLIAASLLDLFH